MNETGPMRREDFLGADAIAVLLSAPDRLDLASILAVAAERFSTPSIPETRTLTVTPDAPAPDLLPEGARAGFLLDLDPPHWRSEWGGLLLFLGDEGRVHGYRPVPGALTLFSAADRPMISLVAPAGARRISILGWWM